MVKTKFNRMNGYSSNFPNRIRKVFRMIQPMVQREKMITKGQEPQKSVTASAYLWALVLVSGLCISSLSFDLWLNRQDSNLQPAH
jgi:hypothetical protein